jgi:hypothetical protein
MVDMVLRSRLGLGAGAGHFELKCPGVPPGDVGTVPTVCQKQKSTPISVLKWLILLVFLYFSALHYE